MKNLHPFSSRLFARNTGKSLLARLCACVLLAGFLYVPAAGATPQSYATLPTVKEIQTTGTLDATATATGDSVKIDQKPLTVRPNIPPNIVLMLDDSGSMASDYMPDSAQYGSDDQLWDWKFNGTYYNPDVIYTPPPKSNGTDYYPDSPGLGDAYKNGFTDTDTTDVTTYDDDYPYYTKLTSTTQTGTYDPSAGCKSGDDLMTYGSHKGECYHDGGWEYSYYNPEGGGRNLHCNAGDYLIWHNHELMCGHREYVDSYYYTPSLDTPYCPQGSLDPDTNKCVVTEVRVAYLFTYTTKDANGNYIPHYVGKTQQDCEVASEQTVSRDCDYSEETQQNVANWFSYYRTRMLMAKSGVMNAFISLDPTYRVGFASINAKGKGNIPTSPTPYYFDDSTWGGGDSKNPLAVVQPFGDGSDGTWKAKFWNWVGKESPGGKTPLRKALAGAGEYYTTEQPWKSVPGEPGYASDPGKLLACRQAYTILTTDGFWNGSSPGTGNQDGNNGDKIQDPNGQSHTYVAADPYKDSQSSTLADVAMKYWKNDLRSDMDNEVPINKADIAFWQHMVTFTLGMGFIPSDADGNPIDFDTVQDLFAWAQADDHADDGQASQPSSLTWGGWPTPESNSPNNIADLVHAAVNGHGGFYSATDPVSFVTGIQNALDRASERVGSGAGVAANSTQLQLNSAVYQAIYHTVEWTGELRAFPITASGLSKKQSWNAAQMMPDAADRDIQTWNPDTKKMVAFKNGSDDSPPTGLSDAEMTALGADSASQAKMVDWLRGSHADEQGNGGTLRNRTVILGDIVDSQPVYVGKVDPNQFAGRSFTGSDDFSIYASGQDDRSARIYVASNDGMLHGFDADTGAETFAFLPAAVILDGVAKTAQPDYGKDSNPHQFFNDGQLTVADAYFAEGSGKAAWHTVLVGTTGRGSARAVYALDVTDPASVKVLWERSAGDGGSGSDYIGQITGKPIIAQVVDASGEDTWVVLIGNGYNSAKDMAALLQFDLTDGTLHVHAAGTATGNGLATPAVWLSYPSTGLSDVAYAGDLKGNVWKFPLVNYGGSTTTGTPDTITGSPDSDGDLVYVAKDASGNRQPITAGMLIGQDPQTSDLWLFFGTGRYLSADDITKTGVQTWYGLDVLTGPSSDMTAVTSTSSRTDLAQRKVIAQFPGSSVTKDGETIVTSPTRVISLPHDMDASTPTIDGTSGWYIDLLAPTAYAAIGERMVIPTQFDGTQILGTSIVPKSNDLCNPSGTSWLNRIDPFTGTGPLSGGSDVNHDGVINGDDMVTVTVTGKDGKTEQKQVVASSTGTNSMANSTSSVGRHRVTSLTNGELLDNLKSGSADNIKRVSWREMVNP